MCDGMLGFFKYEAFLTILEHLKLKFFNPIHWFGKY